MFEFEGIMTKMSTSLGEDNTVQYGLMVNGKKVASLNELIGRELFLDFKFAICCISCGVQIKKTYGRGYCYNCFASLPETDMCMMKPWQCHFDKGTCRDEQFAQKHCFQNHTLYLARSSCIKIGITRSARQLHRWMEQGAVEAKVIGTFVDRKSVGIAEKCIAEYMQDKTNWRKMLTNDLTDESFEKYWQKIQIVSDEEITGSLSADGPEFQFKYPVLRYPQKVKSLKLEKTPSIQKTLTGIKAQYLIFGDEVLNMHSHAGYITSFSWE